jgi:hypothetical protein
MRHLPIKLIWKPHQINELNWRSASAIYAQSLHGCMVLPDRTLQKADTGLHWQIVRGLYTQHYPILVLNWTTIGLYIAIIAAI